MTVQRVCAVLSFIVVGWVAVAEHGKASWSDMSPHQIRFVEVEPGVKLEVLDWGGKGQSVVLLAGYNTAHIYDDFGSKLSKYCHVYGITRRGFGASSVSESGYSAESSAKDVLGVLDRLHIAKPVLVGHSFGGQDLNVIGAEYPQRISGLVYLNSGEDSTLGAGIWDKIGVDPAEMENVRKRLPATMRNPEPEPKDATIRSYREWQARVSGAAMPESELRQLYSVSANGTMGKYLVPKRVRDEMVKGLIKPEFARIRVPALALFAVQLPQQEELAKHKPQNSEELAAVERMLGLEKAIQREHEQELKGIQSIRILELPGANYYIWLSNESDVLREVRAFLEQLRAADR